MALIRYTLEANARAVKIYGPVVERRRKVEKVRNTLAILQRYKFFFNLPSSLLESIKQACTYDYYAKIPSFDYWLYSCSTNMRPLFATTRKENTYTRSCRKAVTRIRTENADLQWTLHQKKAILPIYIVKCLRKSGQRSTRLLWNYETYC